MLIRPSFPVSVRMRAYVRGRVERGGGYIKLYWSVGVLSVCQVVNLVDMLLVCQSSECVVSKSTL